MLAESLSVHLKSLSVHTENRKKMYWVSAQISKNTHGVDSSRAGHEALGVFGVGVLG